MINLQVELRHPGTLYTIVILIIDPHYEISHCWVLLTCEPDISITDLLMAMICALIRLISATLSSLALVAASDLPSI